MASASAVVLCGGRSSRMGRSKAWLPWHGVAMLTHVVARLREIVDDVVVVSSPVLDPPPVDARIVVDETEGQGPLAGIAAGLAAVERDWVFVTGTDVPRLSSALVRALLARNSACAPELDGYVQTLCAVFPRSAVDVATQLLADGVRRPLALLEACDFERLGPRELPDVESSRGLNTPEAYLDAVGQEPGPAEASLEFVGQPRRWVDRDRMTVPIGRLDAVLSHAPCGLEICVEGRVAAPFLVSLGGRDFVRDGRIPVGPGERVVVLDAAAGG